MIYVAKGLEAAGIASVLLGLVQGIQQDDMWTELYLSVLGILLFLVGWGMEKLMLRRSRNNQPSPR
jgi:hypothetical protein